MKKVIAVISCVLIGSFCLCISGCGDKYADSPYTGSWSATTCEMSGLEMNVSDVIGDFIVEFQASGKCKVTVGEESSSGKWKETEEGAVIEEKGEKLVFTLNDDGMLVTDYSGLKLVFEKK